MLKENELINELEICLNDLLSMVKGECPSLLEDYFMADRYEDILDKVKEWKNK